MGQVQVSCCGKGVGGEEIAGVISQFIQSRHELIHEFAPETNPAVGGGQQEIAQLGCVAATDECKKSDDRILMGAYPHPVAGWFIGFEKLRHSGGHVSFEGKPEMMFTAVHGTVHVNHITQVTRLDGCPDGDVMEINPVHVGDVEGVG